MRDGRRVSGGWRQGPNNGGVPLAALAALALPLGRGINAGVGERFS